MLVLERRGESSTAIAIASPLIAVALTLATIAVLFAVLVISQDLDELEEIADRIAVMFEGRMSAPLAAAEADRETLGLLMGGSAAKPKEAARAGA